MKYRNGYEGKLRRFEGSPVALWLLVMHMTLWTSVLYGQSSLLQQVEVAVSNAASEEAQLDTVVKYIDRLFYYGHFQEAYDYAVNYRAFAQKAGRYEPNLLVIQSRFLSRNGKLQEAKAVLMELERISPSDDHLQKAYNLNAFARLYDQENQLDSAIYYNYLADSVSAVHSLPRAKGMLAKADILIKQGRIANALKAADEAYASRETSSDTVTHLWLLYRIADLHARNNSPERYAKYAKEYLEYEAGRKSKYHRGIFDLEYEDRAQRINTLEKVLQSYELEDFSRGILLSKIALIDLYQEDGQDRKAYSLLKDAADGIVKNNFENSIYDLYAQKYDLEKKLGLEKEALQSADKLMQLRDTMQSIALTKQTLEIETQYKTREKEREIQYLNAENDLKDLALKKSSQIKYLLVSGLLLLGILALSLLRNIKQRKRHNEVLTEKNQIIHENLLEKEGLLKEIHHRVKNNLQIISSLLRLQSNSVTDEDAKEVLLEGQNRVQSMALIHQNLYKEEDRTGLEVQEYFEKLCGNLIETYKIDKTDIDLKLDIQPINLDVSTLIPLGLIVNELITNSLKYAFEGRKRGLIGIVLKESNQLLHISVQDDGIGVSEEIKQFLNIDHPGRNRDLGFGTRLIRTFAKKLDAEIRADNSDGTTIELIIKDYKVLHT